MPMPQNYGLLDSDSAVTGSALFLAECVNEVMARNTFPYSVTLTYALGGFNTIACDRVRFHLPDTSLVQNPCWAVLDS